MRRRTCMHWGTGAGTYVMMAARCSPSTVRVDAYGSRALFPPFKNQDLLHSDGFVTLIESYIYSSAANCGTRR